MPRRLVIGLAAAGLLALLITLTAVLRSGEADELRAPAAGDVPDAIARMDPATMPAAAEGLLATDRPWRAARVMRSYLERVPDAGDDHRVLAARAEAEYGAWERVLALLSGVRALDTHAGGVGLYLLARAEDDAGDVHRAVEGYRAFLALSPAAGEMEEERAAARLRLGLALARAGDATAAAREIQLSTQRAGGASIWFGLLQAEALAQRGDTAAVRQAVSGYTSGVQGLRAWRARIGAAERAGDLPQARALANQARSWAGTNATRAEFQVEAARLAIEMGDVAAGRSALRQAIELGAAGPAPRAAAELLRQGSPTPADRLAIARVYAAQGLHEEAVDHFRAWLAAGQGTAQEQAQVHMEHANALFYAQRYDDVPAALRPIAGRNDARMLMARNEAHRRNADEAARIYLDLARGGGGAHALFLAAGVHHDLGNPRAARDIYRRVVAQHPGSRQMGLAMMRLASIAWMEGDHAEAARLWDQYRNRFPRGQLALQSTYWAGRARQEMGDSAGAAALFRAVRQSQRDSYYALRASERLGVPFWPLPMSAAPAESPAAASRVRGWMQGVDLLRNAGFPDEASAEVDRVVAGAGSDRATLYALAEALAERGYAQRAIRIGMRLQGSGTPDRRILRILFPFPYRTLITEETRDRGFDPILAAALIRQESMFEQRITSHVGARGLMQIMPATGRRLAEGARMSEFHDEMLYHPEINVHLGTRYLAQHLGNYDGNLPSVFSAYNAGYHRVEWWQEWPEYGHDEELFTERIPFQETRDYVKILTRNMAVYRGLYGEE